MSTINVIAANMELRETKRVEIKEIKNIAVSLANKVSSQVKSIAKSLSKAVKFC